MIIRLIGVVWCVVGLLVMGPMAWAAPVELPLDAEGEKRLDVGIEYDHVFARELTLGGRATDNDVERFDALYVKGQYEVHQVFNPYVRVGAGQMERHTEDLFLENIGQRDLTFESDWGLAWGGGIAGSVTWPWWGLQTGYDVSYTKVDANLDSVTHADNTLAFSRSGSSVSGDLTWEETQATVWLGRPFTLEWEWATWRVTPYVGGKWSHLNFDVDNARYTVTDAGASRTITFSQASDNDVEGGAVVGVGIAWNNTVIVKAEGHLLDDYGVNGSVSWRF